MHAKFVVRLQLNIPTLKCKEMLEKTEGVIKNAKSRHWQHWVQETGRRQTKQIKQHRKEKKMRNTDTSKYRGLTQVLMKGDAVRVSYKTSDMLLI